MVSHWAKPLVAASCFISLVLAGFLSHILQPVVATADFRNAGLQQANEHMALTLLGQLRMNLDDYFWLRTDDYLHFGVVHPFYTRTTMERSIIDDFMGSLRGASEQRGVSDAAPPKKRDWRGVFRHLEFFYPVKAHHGDPTELLPWYRMQTAINPLDISAYVNGALFLADFAKKPEEALAFLKEGAENNPNSPEIHLAIGRLYYEKWKKYDEAISHLQRAVVLGKGIQERDEAKRRAIGEAYVFLARAYRDKGDLDSAFRVASEGVVECPDNALVRAIYRIVKKGMNEEV